jgi:hypothetical protein
MPVVLYDDIIIKSPIQYLNLTESTFIVSLLSTLSIRDVHFPTQFLDNPVRIQIGFLLLASYISFCYFNIKNSKSHFVWPLIITESLILYIIFNPIIFIGPLKILNFAQFSYRFITFFLFIAFILGVLSISTFYKRTSEFTKGNKKTFSFVLIISSLIFILPYLTPTSYNKPFPTLLNVNYFLKSKFLIKAIGDYNSYLRIPPVNIDKLDDIKSINLIKYNKSINSSNKTFYINLDSVVYKDKNELYLDVLYYPGLQEIKSYLNGKIYYPKMGTFWCKRSISSDPNSLMQFHGLKLSNLPMHGNLVIEVTFIGSKSGNIISLISLLLIIIYIIFINIKKIYINKR